MSLLTERANKPYPADMVDSKDLPSQAPPEHPIPWTLHSGGGGHIYVYDANKVKVAHVYCYYSLEITELEVKLFSINGQHVNVREWL